MIRTMLSAAALAIAALPLVAAAQAQPIEEKNLLSGKAKIEADSGYIYVSGPARQYGTLLRLPDAATIAGYETEWAKEFARVRSEYPSKLRVWQHRSNRAKEQERTPPEKPIEPTAENFSIRPIELTDPAGFGPQFVFAKTKEPESYSYLLRVKPGRYVFYGQLFVDANGGTTGMCYCMGTVAFDVKPGVITDTGSFFLSGSGIDPAFPPRADKVPGSEMGLYRPVAGADLFGPVSYGLPDTLKSYPNERADFRAHGKLDNFYGIMLGRMPPVAGVLAYDRDKVVDLKAVAEVTVAPAPVASAETQPTAAP